MSFGFGFMTSPPTEPHLAPSLQLSPSPFLPPSLFPSCPLPLPPSHTLWRTACTLEKPEQFLCSGCTRAAYLRRVIAPTWKVTARH